MGPGINRAGTFFGGWAFSETDVGRRKKEPAADLGTVPLNLDRTTGQPPAGAGHFSLVLMKHHETIRSPGQLADLCARLIRARRVGVDTEFVSEDTYWPQLCLIQVATDDCLAVIDPLAVSDLTDFWTVLADGPCETIVHAGREELSFCLTALGRGIGNLFDTQLAAGLVGTDYPAGYGALVRRYLGDKADKSATRTDWRRRPLTDEQVRYALADVRYLLPLRDKLGHLLECHGRVGWLVAEIASWQDDIQAARSRCRWRSVSGISGLSSRSLAILRELWSWRDEQARARNLPPRRVLRDDLMIEIARRKSAEPNRIRSIRGIHGKKLGQALPELAACVRRGLELSEGELPRRTHRQEPPQLNLLSQFLAAALRSICAKAQIATGIVGTVNDVRQLIAYRLKLPGCDADDVPILARGWRTEVVGNVLEDLLAGRTYARIHNPSSEHPLSFERTATRSDG